MIAQNLGNVERIIRLCTGSALFLWLAVQPAVSGIDWFIAIISLSLILNGVFSRCYIWFMLDIDTHKGPTTMCPTN
ncbi:MAG: hypothetical protein ACI8QT_002050 [Halioglobus sp.]|jgi:hypothetical protein